MLLTAQPTVTFVTPVVTPASSGITVGTVSGGSATVTVTLRDQAADPQPVVGQTVSVTGTGSVVITPASSGSDVTNSSGVATFTTTDSQSESVTLTANDTTPSTAILIGTTSVTFGTLVVSPTVSTVVVNPSVAPLAGNGAQVTVTLLTSGSSPVEGRTIALTYTGNAGNTVTVGEPSSGTGSDVTNSSGVAIFQVTDTAPETITLTATDSTDTIPLSTMPTITFQASAPSAATSTVTTGSSQSVADGQTETPVTVMIDDQFGVAVPGQTVTIQVSGSAEEHPFSSVNAGVTNASGQAQFEVSDTAAETVTISATDTSPSPALIVTQTATIVYSAGSPDPGSKSSTVVASNTNPPADGTTTTTLTVTLTDEFGNPVTGQIITLSALPSGNGAHITTVNGTTNGSGEATFSAVDAATEVVTFQATDTSDNNTTLTSEAVVTFGNPPIPPPVADFCSVVVSPSSVPADGTTAATISVLLYNGDGDVVPGKNVSLTASSGTASSITTVNGTSTSTGNALFTVTDTTAESVTYTAEDTTDNVNLTNLPVTVTFGPAASSTTTTTTTAPSSTTTTGQSATTTTATGAAVATDDSSSSGDSGTSSTGGSDGGSLAFTGVSCLVPWLAGLGVVMTGIGTLGRRRFKRVHQ